MNTILGIIYWVLVAFILIFVPWLVGGVLLQSVLWVCRWREHFFKQRFQGRAWYNPLQAIIYWIVGSLFGSFLSWLYW